MTIRTHHPLRRTGKVLAIALPVVGIVGLSALVAIPSQTSAQEPERPALEDIASRSLLVQADLAHLGLTPEVLAAAGVSAGDAASIVSLLEVDSDFGADRYRAARSAHEQAQAAVDKRAALIRSGRASLSQVEEKAALVAHAGECLEACVGAEADSMLIVERLVGVGRASLIRTIRTNAEYGTPLPYAATELTASERLWLRDALAARRFAQRTETALDPDVSSFFEDLDARPEVVSARDSAVSTELIRDAMRGALDAIDTPGR